MAPTVRPPHTKPVIRMRYGGQPIDWPPGWPLPGEGDIVFLDPWSRAEVRYLEWVLPCAEDPAGYITIHLT